MRGKWNYGSAGSGTPLLLLHGVTRRWQSFLPVMAGLGLRHRVMALDLPGHGESLRLPRYRVADYVDPLVRFLRRGVAEPAVVYGHSLGSMLAAAIAAEAPDRVRALVMEDPPFEAMGARIADGPLLGWFAALQPFAGKPCTGRELGEARANGIPLRELRDEVALRFTAASLARMDPAVLEPIVAREWMLGYDRDSILRRVQCPSLLMQADPAQGGMLTDEDAAASVKALRDCSLVRVAAPHLINWADPGGMVRLVHGFLSSLE